MTDLIGIGAINLDRVVDAAAAAAIDIHDPRHLRVGFVEGGERAIDVDELVAAQAYLSTLGSTAVAGGSSLNVLASVAGTGAPIEVAMVGRCGVDAAGFDFPAWFAERGIGTGLVEFVHGSPGVCLSYTRDGERTLLTTGGANDGLPDFFRRWGPGIVEALARARAAHIASLVDSHDLTPLVAILDEAVRRNPALSISVDPGALWSTPDRHPSVDGVLALADLLLMNRRELADLSGTDGSDVVEGAAELMVRLPRLATVVVKGADGVDVCHRRNDDPEDPDALTGRFHPNDRVLALDEIVDDTGTGDAFAAGFLLGRLLPGWTEDDGVALGMDLARVKLGFAGLSGAEAFARPFADRAAAVSAAEPPPAPSLQE